MSRIYRLQDENTDTTKINRILESVVNSLKVPPDQRLPSQWIHTDLMYLEGHHLAALKDLVAQNAGTKMITGLVLFLLLGHFITASATDTTNTTIL